MIRMLRLSSVLVPAALALAACDDAGADDGEAELQIQERFGGAFAAAFNADENAEPINPTSDTLPPVSFTTDPVDF